MGEQLEDDGGGDLVRDVSHAHVEVGQLCLEDVALDNLQPGEVRVVRRWIEKGLKRIVLSTETPPRPKDDDSDSLCVQKMIQEGYNPHSS